MTGYPAVKVRWRVGLRPGGVEFEVLGRIRRRRLTGIRLALESLLQWVLAFVLNGRLPCGPSMTSRLVAMIAASIGERRVTFYGKSLCC